MIPVTRALFALSLALSLAAGEGGGKDVAQIAVDLHDQGKAISPDLFGIFFEDINYAADGGLYAELIQNRSFEYQAQENATWNQLTSWELVQRGTGKGRWKLQDLHPLHPNNPHYLLVRVDDPGAGVGILNQGFDGIPVRAGEEYRASFQARLIHCADPAAQGAVPVSIRLEDASGAVISEKTLTVQDRDWQTQATWRAYETTLVAERTVDDARLVVLINGKATLTLDEVSLFPRKTFKDRPNGLRRDLAQTIADLRPRFMRFPGGCVAHGEGLNNMYRWKDTIGPVEQRRGQRNRWGYHQSMGLGYFEYFQFCEDIGAKPLPVVPAGVCCQFSEQRRGFGQEVLPMAEMPAYVQEVLDLIEWANGPATSTWGRKRAEAGHPEPFHLEYLGVGNEDAITPGFKERFTMIQRAVKAAYPGITVIGTTGPEESGKDFAAGWKFAAEAGIPMVDEHYYMPPQWFFDHVNRYDAYDRKGSTVYLGEYAAGKIPAKNTWQSALSEAAFLTGLERNGDLVRMSSYAPLLAKRGQTQWAPDLIYFTNTRIHLSTNYLVQKLFSTNAGDRWHGTAASGDHTGLFTSVVTDGATGDLIIKIVSNRADQVPLRCVFTGAPAQGVLTVAAGDPAAVNDEKTPEAIAPRSRPIALGAPFVYDVPPYSLSVIRAPQLRK